MPVARDECRFIVNLSLFAKTFSFFSIQGPLVFNAVRAVHPTTPIVILGGRYICKSWGYSLLTVQLQGIPIFAIVVSLSMYITANSAGRSYRSTRWSFYGPRKRTVHGNHRLPQWATPLFLMGFADRQRIGAKLDNKNSTDNITFSRRYLDPNRVTYEVSCAVRFFSTG
jgi:hypothetical protein